MKNPDNNLSISTLLLRWYDVHKRDLPWRGTHDPYAIWISEIILQQTRIQQGWDYFVRFMRRFPDVVSLAQAHEDDVLKLWQGLGYYSRARNLHAAAQQVVDRFGGQFPRTYSDILSLKGIGEYTAAAIASIAYNEPYAAVDGNVFRVLSRLFDIDTPINTPVGKKQITAVAQSILHPRFPGLHNQAMMDLGAMVCTPAQPECVECPFQEICLALARNKVADLPVKNRLKTVRNRYFHYFHIRYGDKVYIRKRIGRDIWKNLYEFPLVETDAPADFAALQDSDGFKQLFSPVTQMTIRHAMHLKHVLSHQVIYADFYQVDIDPAEQSLQGRGLIEIPGYRLGEYAVSRLVHKYIETI
ncbi:MAG TPA: A/G-specific adenine glycosylase [Porphyromonadaceae bacterium]|jgi:A/G-specific adenine glycosylase|nr:A/G-specific adenine glycosylase [Porphyromonadaceae bacterium]HBL33509.1 A/G-specific adenine glycosylase [Porphyromonadaceae bacterium]HBX19595.1 A/G-specific adenine glycosylase [Porphyromonadaceae bacterium]HCM19327.1 A/G-specific adenine glycosylase [Porphyromonadaceae bacterium]